MTADTASTGGDNTTVQSPEPPAALAGDFFAACIAEKSASFTGRGWLFAQLDEWLSFDQCVLLEAAPGFGKSALLAGYIHRSHPVKAAAWYFCQQDRRRTLRPGTFVRSLIKMLYESVPGYRDAIAPHPELQHPIDEAYVRPGHALDAAVFRPFADIAPPDDIVVLVVDGLDEALQLDPADAPQGSIVDLLAQARRFPRWLRVLAASRPSPAVRAGLKGAFAVHTIAAGSTEHREDLRQHILAAAAREAGLRAWLARENLSPGQLAALLLDRSAGSFLFVTQVLRHLASGAPLPDSLGAFYGSAIERGCGSPQEEIYRQSLALLGVVCAAADPLVTTELAAILEQPESTVLAAQARLPGLVRLRGAEVSLDHRCLHEWLTQTNQNTNQETDQDIQDTQRQTAHRFASVQESRARMRRWAIACVQAGSAHRSSYLQRNLALHLEDSQERCAIYEQLLLGPLEWSLARIAVSGATALQEDVELIAGHPEQVLYKTLIREAMPALRESPAHWPAQILGRLGTGPWNLGLARLTYAAERWAAAHAPQHSALLPLTRSLLWRREQLRQFGGMGPVVVMPDGRIAYNRSPDICVQDPDATVDLAPQLLGGTSGWVTALAVLPDGRLVSGQDDGSIRVWTLDGGAAELLEGHTDWVRVLLALPDGRVASGSDDGSVRVWTLDGSAPKMQVLKGHASVVTALTVLPGGQLVSGSLDGSVRVWTLDGSAPKRLEGHTNAVRALLALPDGTVASASDDHSVRLWRLDGSAAKVLEGHAGAVSALALLPSGALVSGSYDGTVRIWRLDGSAPEVLEHGTSPINVLALLSGGLVATGSEDGSLQVWALDGSAPRVLEGHSGPVTALAALSDGRLVSGSNDRSVRVWALDGRPVLQEHTDRVKSLAVLPDGRVISGSDDHSLRVWTIDGRPPAVLEGHNLPVSALAVLSNGRVVSGGTDASIRMWTLDGSAHQVLEGHTDFVMALAELPDGRLVSASADGTMRVWALNGGAPQVLQGSGGWIVALLVLPDGRVVSGSGTGELWVWTLTGSASASSRNLEGHTSWISELALLPDGRVASCSRDCTVRVCAPDGNSCEVLQGHTDWVRALAVLPDGRLASSSHDKSLRVWAPDGTSSQVRHGHSDWVTALAVLPDGRLISGGDDGLVRVWSRALEIQHSFFADSGISCLTVIDAATAAAACRDGTVHFLRVPPG